MCFSAEASFTGGVIITAIGIATVTKVHKPSQLIFACIPIFFGIQQVAEGILWLTIPHPEYDSLRKFVTYFFLIMADVLWPMIIPLSVLFMEENRKKKKALWIFLSLGMILSGYYAICLIIFHVYPKIMGYHIQYISDFPDSLSMPAFFVYLIVPITPFFISSINRTQLMGILMFFSCAVTAIFFTQFLTSVWCFFAALISGVIYWILSDSKRKFKFDRLNSIKNEVIIPMIQKIAKP
jgi:hypothetical protein